MTLNRLYLNEDDVTIFCQQCFENPRTHGKHCLNCALQELLDGWVNDAGMFPQLQKDGILLCANDLRKLIDKK